MANNVLAPTNVTTLLCADQVQAANGSPDSTASLTKVGSNYAAVCAEFQSTSGGVLFPRMTSAQIAALPLAGQSLVAGTMIYNTTTNSFATYGGSSFVTGSTSVSGTLTAANVTAMYATPVQIASIVVPAGYVAVIDKFILNYVFAVAFAGGGAISLEYGSTAHAAGTLATATIAAAELTAANNTYSVVGGAALGSNSATFSGIGIYISNDTATFTGGAGSTVNYTIVYRVLPIV